MNKYLAILSLIFTLFSTYTMAQFTKFQVFNELNMPLGFCSRSILLDTSGIFYDERGCENHSDIAVGNYAIKNGIIVFSYKSIDSLKIIKHVEVKKRRLIDSIQKIRVLSLDGEVFNGKLLLIGDNLIKELNGFRKVVFSKNYENRIETLELNYDYIEPFIHLKLEDVIAMFDVDIYLNVPAAFLYGDVEAVDDRENFSCIIREDGLYNKKTKTKIFKAVESK